LRRGISRAGGRGRGGCAASFEGSPVRAHLERRRQRQDRLGILALEQGRCPVVVQYANREWHAPKRTGDGEHWSSASGAAQGRHSPPGRDGSATDQTRTSVIVAAARKSHACRPRSTGGREVPGLRLSRPGEDDCDRGGVSASGMTPVRSTSSKVVRVVSMLAWILSGGGLLPPAATGLLTALKDGWAKEGGSERRVKPCCPASLVAAADGGSIRTP
jgi:hypothetical protein